jgi:hypothetical protein
MGRHLVLVPQQSRKTVCWLHLGACSDFVLDAHPIVLANQTGNLATKASKANDRPDAGGTHASAGRLSFKPNKQTTKWTLAPSYQ